MTERERLTEICTALAIGCAADFCSKCEYKSIDYPRCRGVYMADRIVKELEEEKK